MNKELGTNKRRRKPKPASQSTRRVRPVGLAVKSRMQKRSAGPEVKPQAQRRSPAQEEAYLDESLEQTFPASDPLPYGPRRRKTGAGS